VDAEEGQDKGGNSKEGLDRLATIVVERAMVVHSALGPGLLESVYEACLAHELAKVGLSMQRQVTLPVHYDGTVLDAGFRVDVLVAKHLVVEIKAVEKLLPIHSAQLLTYLKLGGFRLGSLLNFNVVHMRDGLKRVAHGL
jgi:GxxExxY protein